MDASELAELRTMYVFGPAEGSTWGMTYEEIEAKLRERETDTFVRIDEGEEGPVRGSVMHFGIRSGVWKPTCPTRLFPTPPAPASWPPSSLTSKPPAGWTDSEHTPGDHGHVNDMRRAWTP
ncbi:hypothetical protein ACFCZ1_06255 [Streptomyces sp. NPDC056224]|uniref:hypothetical protein n=1 Tax=Streptomyces sp. NPDC056224 TaxID=3345750 RepID=UPI0035DDA3ED